MDVACAWTMPDETGASPPNAVPARVSVSTATLNDFFPDTRAFELMGGQRPFAIVTRTIQDNAEAVLIVVAANGTIHELVSKGDHFAPSGQSFAIEDLRDVDVIRVVAATVSQESIVTVISARTKDGAPLLVAVGHWEDRWERLTLPVDDEERAALAQSMSSGFAALQHNAVIYFAAVADDDPKRRIRTFMFAHAHQPERIGLHGDVPPLMRAYHLLSVAPERQLRLACAEGSRLSTVDLTIVEFPQTTRFHEMPPDTPAGTSLSHLLPINDSAGLCHGMFVRSTDNQLFVTTFSQSDAAPLRRLTGRERGPAAVTDVTASFDHKGDLHVFAIDAAAVVWYARAPRGTDVGDITWKPSGQCASNLEAPPLTPGRPFVLAEGRLDRLDCLVVCDGDDVWTRVGIPFTPPRARAVRAAVHRITLTALTTKNEPVEGTALRIRAERPVMVEHEGVLYEMGPDRPLHFATNFAGNVAFRVRAAGFDDAPPLLVSSPDISSLGEQKYKATESALRRIAGREGTFAVSGAALQEAGLVPRTLSAGNAERIAQVLRASAEASLDEGVPLAPRLSSGRGPGAAHIRGVPGEPEPDTGITIVRSGATYSVQEGDVIERGSTRRSLDSGAAVRTSPASFWSWLSEVWDSVQAFAVRVVEQTIHLVVKAGEAIVEFFSEAARYITNGVQSVLSWMAGLGSDLVEMGRRAAAWVAEALPWDDVIRCKNVVRDYTRATLMDLHVLLGRSLPAKLSEAITSLKSDVDALFADAIARLGGPVSPTAPAEASPASGPRFSAKTTLFHDAFPSGATAESLFKLSPDLQAKIEQLAADGRRLTEGQELRSLLEALEPMFRGRTTPEQAASIGIGELLQLVRRLAKLALDAVDVVQSLLFEILGAVVGMVLDALQKPLADLGGAFAWIDSLYRHISGDDRLTLLDLVSLLFVAPGVIVHHIVHGRPVLEPSDVPRTPPMTALGLASRLMSASDATAVAPVKEEATGWARVWEIVAAAVLPLQQGIMAVTSVAENLYRANVIRGLPSAPLITVAQTIHTVMNWVPTVLHVGYSFFHSFVPHMQTTGRIELMIVAMAAAIIGPPLISIVLRLYDAIPAVVRVVAMAFIGFCVAPIQIAYHAMAIRRWDGTVGGSIAPRDRAIYGITETAAMVLSIIGFVRIGAPIGANQVQIGDVVTGNILIAVNIAGESLLRLGYAAAMTYRATL